MYDIQCTTQFYNQVSIQKRCYWCDCRLDKNNRSTDHMNPKFRGGTDSFRNYRACCKSCNIDKDVMTEKEYESFKAMSEKLTGEVRDKLRFNIIRNIRCHGRADFDKALLNTLIYTNDSMVEYLKAEKMREIRTKQNMVFISEIKINTRTQVASMKSVDENNQRYLKLKKQFNDKEISISEISKDILLFRNLIYRGFVELKVLSEIENIGAIEVSNIWNVEDLTYNDKRKLNKMDIKY